MFAGLALDVFNFVGYDVHNFGHTGVHVVRVTTLDEVGVPPVAAEKLLKLFVLDTRENSWVANFIAVKVQNWEHCTVGFWV